MSNISSISKSIQSLKKHYPDVRTSLDFNSPFELLTCVILSAQCTDERINKVSPALFKAFPDPEKMSKAPLVKLEQAIASVTYFRSKSKYLKGMANKLVNCFSSKVPSKMEDLLSLPGVGRKTANVIRGVLFGIPAVVVDTHVKRLSYRLGWTQSEDPLQIEKDLESKIAKEDWIDLAHLLIAHGRGPCQARKPNCQKCFLRLTCPKHGLD